MSDVAAASTACAIAPPPAPPAKTGVSMWSPGGFSFKDLLDIVNPLQHIPVIGSIYRYLTGDEPTGGARLVGDSLYGGPIGFGVSVVTSMFLNDADGHDMGERVLAKVFGPRDGMPDSATTAVASATPPAAPASGAAAAQPTASAAVPVAATPLAAPIAGQPVATNQLFRSPSAPLAATPASAAASTPEQAFLAQKALYQRQMTNARGADGTMLNNRPVPLELSSNFMPVLPPGAKLVTPAAMAAKTAPSGPSAPSGAASGSANPGPDASPIAQKMTDALAKYEQLKKQQQQQSLSDKGSPSPGSPTVDLAL